MSLAYSVILPAYNEAASIDYAIRETKAVFEGLGESFEIIVVDDGSQDATVDAVERIMEENPHVFLVRQKQNSGKGMAVKRGVEASRGEMLLFLDCDLATHPSAVIPFIAEVRAGRADIAIGSRRAAGSHIVVPQPWYRVALGRMFNLCIRWYLHLPYKDTQCGFKLFTREAAKRVFSGLLTSGWAFDVEILVRAHRAGLRVVEKPVVWRNGRESRVRITDAWMIFQELRRIKRLC